MSEVGALIVKLRAETAEFRSDMGKVKQDLNDLKDHSDDAGKSMSKSMTDSREAVMLLGNEVGVTMPRALSMYISKMPGVAAATQAAFPIIGIVAAIAIIGKLIAKHEEAAQAIRDAAAATQQLNTKERDLVIGLKDANLQLEDEIAKLEKRPGTNKLALALDAVKKKTDELVTTFDTDFKKLDDDVSKYTSSWIQDFEDYYAASKGSVAAGSMQEQADAFAALTAARQKLNAAEQNQENIDPKTHLNEWKVATGQVATEAGHVQAAFDRARAAVLALHPAGNAMTEEFVQGAVAAKTEWQSMAEQIKNVGLEVRKVHDESAIDQRKPVENLAKSYEDIIKAKKRVAQADIDIADALKELANLDVATFNKEQEATAKVAEENSKLAASYREIEEARLKAEAQSARTKVQSEASLGLLSKQQEARQLLAIDQKELADYKASLAAKLQDQKTYLDNASAAAQAAQQKASQALGTPEQGATQDAALKAALAATQAQITYNAAVKESVGQMQALNDKVKQQQTVVTSLQKTWQKFFGEMNQEVPTLAQNINGTLQASMTKFTDNFSNALAKTIVESKSLSAAMRQMGKEILEDAISSFIRWKIMNAEKAGAAAFSNALTEGSPLPVAVVEGGVAFAKALAFEQGGEIPGAGPVPIIAHGGETVVTKHLTDQVKNGGIAGSGATHIHYSPQIHAVDSDGVERMLKKHSAIFTRHVTSQMRRLNK